MNQDYRNYGIDLLKIVAMGMILVLHLLGHGGILKELASSPPEFLSTESIVWLLEAGALCAVNCYGILTGYNLYGVGIKLNKIICLYLQIIFYSAGITFVFYYTNISIGTPILIKSVFPILCTCYWYITAYFGTLFFVPMVNNFVSNSSRFTLNIILIMIFSVFSALPTIFGLDPFKINNGYSTLWLLVLYIFGAYIKKYDIKGVIYFKYYVVAVLFSWGSKICMELFIFYVVGNIKNFNMFIRYTSPSIVLAAIFLVLTFNSIKISNKKMEKIIRLLASTSLGVYLIHEHPLIRVSLVKNSMIRFADMTTIELIFVILIIAIIVYLFCSCVDFVRNKLFKYLKINLFVDRICRFIEEKVHYLLNGK